MLKTVDLSICISYYNADVYLAMCLASIERYPPSCSYEVLVVDDASPHPCRPMVEERFPTVRVITNSTNLGFAGSNNAAIRESRGRYILLLNNDTEVLLNSVDDLVTFLDRQPDVGAVGPMLLNTDGSFQPQCKRGMLTPMSGIAYSLGFDRWFPTSRLFGEYSMTYTDPGQTQEVKGLSGACMLVRRDAINQVGLLDERFGMYGEDLDWCYRLRAGGWRVCYVPDAKVVHHGGKGGSEARSYRNIYLYNRALWLLFTRYRQTRCFPLYGWLVWLTVAFRLVGCVLINGVRQKKRVGSKKGREVKGEVLDEPVSRQSSQSSALALRRPKLTQAEPNGIRSSGEFLKRLFDSGLAAFALLLSLPLWGIIALARKFEDGGPISYRQVRVGHGGKNFILLKFRSMWDGAERETGIVWASENDPRVTRVGRVLRNTALDELPQLWNILRGDLSFVGPRAERPEFVVKFSKEIINYNLRHTVRPGLTGLAQICGRYDSRPRHKLKYDLLYIRKRSFWLDFRLICVSFVITFLGRWDHRDKKLPRWLTHGLRRAVSQGSGST